MSFNCAPWFVAGCLLFLTTQIAAQEHAVLGQGNVSCGDRKGVANIPATISIGRQLHSSMNSDRSSDASSAYVDTKCPAAGFVGTILNQYGPLFERRRAEWARRRVPQPLPLGVIHVGSILSAFAALQT